MQKFVIPQTEQRVRKKSRSLAKNMKDFGVQKDLAMATRTSYLDERLSANNLSSNTRFKT